MHSWLQLQYQMYIEKFDMMRMVDYVEKQINECLNGSRTMTNEDLMCDIIEKMNFYTQHNALEKILLARELVWTVSFLLASTKIFL